VKAWWRRRTLRFRLAAWYGAGGTLLLAVFSATLYFYVAETIARPLDFELRHDLAEIREHLAITADGRMSWDGAEVTDLARWAAENPWFELWNAEGHLVRRFWPFTESRVESLPVAPEPGRDRISIFNVARDLRLRVLSVRYAVPERGETWMIRVMTVHRPMADGLGALRLIIVVALPVVIVLLVVGGYALTRRWLKPLDLMVAEANRITADDLDRRLPVVNPHDELGRLAGVFNVTLDRLEGSFVALDRFVADASHELRTPLTTLRSVGEVGLRRSRTTEEYREIIGSMLEEAQRLQLLTQRLLELASMQGGASAVQRAPMRVDEFVRVCVGELGILAENKNQRIVLETVACAANTDSVLLRQAVQNLVDNAIKYSPDGSTIRVGVRVAAGGECCVEVTDEGPGIGAEFRAQLMARFYRPDSGRGRGRGGFGLGLALTKAYLRLLGGTVEFEPAPGGGSTFRLTWPSQ
jgi:heavy metal sensor kinase